MKILFFARLFYPHIGGVEKHVLKISKILINKGYTVTVITENYQSLPPTAKFEGINIIRINAGSNDWFKKFRVWRELFKHFQIIKNADIVHCHDIFFWYLPFRFIFPFKNNYVTFHGYEGNNIPNTRSIFMHKLAEKFSNGNLCIGNFYKKWYGTNATLVSFGAVDKKILTQSTKDNKITKDAMFLGRLEKETGIMEYLKAIKELKLSLDVYGNGSLEEEARKYVKDNNLKINFKGFVENATDYIKDYRYIFTSRYLGILEAMASKRPVYAIYNNKTKKDYLEMTPFSKWVLISKNEEDLVKKFNSSNMYVDKAYSWVKSQTWENMTNLYLILWELKL